MDIKFKLFCEKVEYEKANTYLTEENAIKYVKENCKQWLKNPTNIIRNISFNLPTYTVIDPKKYNRKSVDNVPNYYTLIIDNSEPWKDYPKRKNSLICRKVLDNFELNKFSTANKYLIIPKDNSKWGICEDVDIWFSFETLDKYGYENIKDFVKDLNHISLIYFNHFIDDNSYDNFKEDINTLDDMVKNDNSIILQKDDKYYNIYNLIKSSNNFMKKLIKLLNPNKNYFKLVNYNELRNMNLDYNEIWTDSDCLVIKLIDFIKTPEKENVLDKIYNLFK